MKTTKLMILGALIGTCTFAAAQEEKPARPEGGGRGMRQPSPEMLKKFDKDGDGKLSQEEAKAAREARQAEMLKLYDKDGDGKLSDDETKAMREAQQAKRKALIEKYDADKDGKLDETERKAAADAGEDLSVLMGGRGPGGGQRRGGPEGKPGDTPPAAPGN
jgi:Ca2+-binding EF-hand superfamily protein